MQLATTQSQSAHRKKAFPVRPTLSAATLATGLLALGTDCQTRDSHAGMSQHAGFNQDVRPILAARCRRSTFGRPASHAQVQHGPNCCQRPPFLLRAIELYQGTQLTRLAIKLMALAFVRTSELIGARWDEFDLEDRRGVIPAERMKMKTPNIAPPSSQAIEVLQLHHMLSGSGELLFPGDHDRNKLMSNMTILKALERMGYKGRMTGHGFRGLASTILHEQGYNHDHIELQMAHSPRNAIAAANSLALYLESRARMMQDWAGLLERSMRGGRVIFFRETA
jgi:integrase